MADNKQTYDRKPESSLGERLEKAVACDFSAVERGSTAQRSRSDGFPSLLQLKVAATMTEKAVLGCE